MNLPLLQNVNKKINKNRLASAQFAHNLPHLMDIYVLVSKLLHFCQFVFV